MQRRGPIRREIPGLVELVTRIRETQVRAVRRRERVVTGCPGEVWNGCVQVGQSGGEEEGPEVCAGEGGDCIWADLPCAASNKRKIPLTSIIIIITISSLVVTCLVGCG